MPNVAKQSSYIISSDINLQKRTGTKSADLNNWKWVESVRLIKKNWHNWTLADKVVFRGLTILVPLYIMVQLKWVTVEESQVSQCWSGILQTNKERSLEKSMW